MKRLLTLACIVCTQIAAAQTISYALRWDGSAEKLVSVDVATGINTDIGIISNVQGVIQGSSFVTANGTYFFVGSDNTDTRLYTIDVSNASVIYNPVIPYTLMEVQYDCRYNTLYALWKSSATSPWQLVTVDAITGSVTVIGAAIPNLNGVAQGMSTFNAANGHYIFEGSDSNWDMRLYELDVQTGAVVISPVLPGYINDIQFNYYNSTYYGLWRSGTDVYLVSVDNVTGAKTVISIIPGLYGIVQGSAMINSVTNAYALQGTDAGNVSRYYEINLITGSVIYNTTLSQLVFEIKNNEYNYCSFMAATTGIHETAASASFSIEPNPVSDVLNLNAGTDFPGSAIVTVYSILGKKIVAVKTHTQETKLHVGNLEKGLYFVEITDAYSSFSKCKKFIKE